MIMRWMKLEGTTFCTLSLYFLLFSWNKVKIVFSCLFSELSVQYKNTPKIKVLQMPWNWNMIFFWNIWEYLALRTQQGGHPPAHEGGGRALPLGAPPASWAHGGPPPLIPAPTHFFLPKKSPSSSSTSSSSFCCDFRSPCSKHLSQNCFGGLFLGMWLLHWSN